MHPVAVRATVPPDPQFRSTLVADVAAFVLDRLPASRDAHADALSLHPSMLRLVLDTVKKTLSYGSEGASMRSATSANSDIGTPSASLISGPS
jgi:hypothetical protein